MYSSSNSKIGMLPLSIASNIRNASGLCPMGHKVNTESSKTLAYSAGATKPTAVEALFLKPGVMCTKEVSLFREGDASKYVLRDVRLGEVGETMRLKANFRFKAGLRVVGGMNSYRGPRGRYEAEYSDE